jgi:DNA-binding HxlR family transcriptional regulator
VQGVILRTVTRRTYDQYCGIARALDTLGERWTLLLVRELLIGPKRFSDLMEGLPGIGANALSTRLKSMEGDGLLTKRRLPPPAASTVYELTERGRALEPAINELARWGATMLEAPGPETHFRTGWIVTGLRAMFDPQAAAGISRNLRLRVDDEVFAIRVHQGTIEVEQGEGGDPDIDIATDSETVLAISSGKTSAEEAVADGRVAVLKGEPMEAVAFASWMRLPAAVQQAA